LNHLGDQYRQLLHAAAAGCVVNRRRAASSYGRHAGMLQEAPRNLGFRSGAGRADGDDPRERQDGPRSTTVYPRTRTSNTWRASLPPLRSRAAYFASHQHHLRRTDRSVRRTRRSSLEGVQRAGLLGLCGRDKAALAVGLAGGECLQCHSVLRAAGCSIRRQCAHRRCSTVGSRNGPGWWKALRDSHANGQA
jgi:hypothetical protein